MSASAWNEDATKVAWVVWSVFLVGLGCMVALVVIAPRQKANRRAVTPSEASVRHYQHRVYEVEAMLDSTEVDLVECRRHVARAEVVLPRLVRFKLGKGAP